MIECLYHWLIMEPVAVILICSTDDWMRKMCLANDWI